MSLRVLVCLSLWLALADASPVAYGQNRPGQVDRPLQQLAQQSPLAAVRVIVQAMHPADAERAVGLSAGQLKAHLPHVAGVSAEVRADQVEALSRQPGIVRVSLDPQMRAVRLPVDPTAPVSVFPQAVGAPTVWSSGASGRGIAIAILDSGIQPHGDLGPSGRIAFAERFNQGASSTADQYGHGTWVAGIAAGNGAASDGRYVGIAPAASIVNLKVSDDSGKSYASNVLQALGWVVNHHAEFNIRVVNLSFVSSVAEGYATNLLDAAVEVVWHSGVSVVVAAGNRGANTVLYAPANDPYVITVGANDDAGTATTLDDSLAWFSSFGIAQGGFPKPDLVAPGRHIVGPLASSGAVLAREFPSRVIDQQYIRLSGTSAAAPIVSGGVALLAQVRPDLKPDQAKWVLQHTARPIQNAAAGTGAGELDIAAAATTHGSVPRANLGLIPNRLVGLAYLSLSGQSQVSWDSVNWDSVSWDSVSWASVSWDSVSWDSASWDSASWDSVLGND